MRSTKISSLSENEATLEIKMSQLKLDEDRRNDEMIHMMNIEEFHKFKKKKQQL